MAQIGFEDRESGHEVWTHCPFPRASVNVTCWHAWHKVCEQGGKWKLAKNTNTIRGTVTDMGKGQNLTHDGFHWGAGNFMKKHTCWEDAVTVRDTTFSTYDTFALHYRHLRIILISPRWYSYCFFFFVQSVSLLYLPVISSSRDSSLSLLSSPSLHLFWRGHCSWRGNIPSSRFSIELSDAGCFNKSFPMKGQGTLCEVASPMTLSFGALQWTLSARTSLPQIKSTWQAFPA